MPSLHVAWTAWVARTAIELGAPRWLRTAAVLQVGTTTAVIVMTGNHWLLDAAAGVLVAVVVDRAVATAFRVWREARSTNELAPPTPIRPAPVRPSLCAASAR
jgi:hypothetical protein